MKINKISPQDNNFAKVLVDIAKEPQALYYIGSLPTERRPAVAIVGTRKPSTYGEEVAYTFAKSLAQHGVVIISGMALGVDAIAHKAALDIGGTTIAVQANGLDRLYPASHQSLGESIVASGGAIVSEYPAGTSPRQYAFLARNRIVSGLADAVLVVEAAKRSGTLSTANHALEQGKEVFAVPGNITNPLSAGCNALIAQGATPALDAATILDVVIPKSKQQSAQLPLPLAHSPLEAKIIALLQAGVRDGDALHEQTGVSASEFSAALSMMEIDGSIRSLGANQWGL